ncbi:MULTISPECIES: ALF repeat-containing protein [Streptomyces]|uniref:Uncharacterized protein n=2 Tax=Streptomyces rimosus TaxID=1927 RepID=A0A8A1V0E1_STRR1|nr:MULTISPECIES: ALF repeat-containing protein [Streptomyces]MYT47510.1 hypothetical protein [Streptomyces sp. SID5471]QGY70984.1 hypothetical protein V519_038435 [Streptomyces rimosus R6-500]QST86766.1 hypothetical protein SRIM_040765 [Streptomyces rimosus subsp. rimosus ATCC 10970]QDA10380.1 hypothetical protein CTZ40_42245 [Streptomyces rimosus]QTL84595.1 hypothetical protein FMM49_01215 [Streptomyces rimosus subsp. rimosus]
MEIHYSTSGTGSSNSHGTWSREAARFALAGTDTDVHAWIDTDRAVAQGQDDRETVLYLAQISSPTIAEAARKALESDASDAPTTFLESGAIQAAADDNRVQISRILTTEPGTAVRRAVTAALDDGSPKALHTFFNSGYQEALKEDDAVATASILAKAGPYTKAHAEAAMEGPAWIRRNFVASVQYKTAQLDHDSATHIAAIRGAIAAAAKVAHKAQEVAARAQEAAAKARDAAQDALEWADKATKSSDRAASYAKEAKDNADAADKSAAAAQASANEAKKAAATARSAARSANFSANRALNAARRATASANSAQAAAASARASAIQAGKDARTAAVAASQARTIAAAKRQAEIAAAARAAAEAAKKARESGKNPIDTPENDQVKGDDTPWWRDAGWWANATNWASIGTGFLSAGLGIVGLIFPPAAPILEPIAGGLAIASVALGGISALFTGIEHGFTSSEFWASAGSAALGLITFGQSKWIGAVGGSKVVTKITQFGHDLVSPVTGLLGSLGF